MTIKELNNELGNADLYLIDQILKDRFDKNMRILDVGCGEGRNLVYFIKNNFKIYGIDKDESAIHFARSIAGTLNKTFTKENLIVSDLTDAVFPPQFFQAIICINVLHFSKDEDEFYSCFSEMVRMIDTNGIIFLCMESEAKERKSGHVFNVECQSQNERRFLFTNKIESELESRLGIVKIENAVDVIINDVLSYAYRIYKKEVSQL